MFTVCEPIVHRSISLEDKRGEHEDVPAFQLTYPPSVQHLSNTTLHDGFSYIAIPRSEQRRRCLLSVVLGATFLPGAC